MEARKIIIIESRNQNKTIINSTATTLGELKRDLDKVNVDYNGMAFYEGISKTEIKVDDSILPHDIPYKGTTTNELVFMLTNPVKKIKSGFMTRKEILNKVKEYGLQDKIKDLFDKHYTNVSSVGLLNIISQYEDYMEKEAETKENEASSNDNCIPNSFNNKKGSINTDNVGNALKILVNILYKNDILTDKNMEEIWESLSAEVIQENTLKKEECPYSNNEIDDMFNFIDHN